MPKVPIFVLVLSVILIASYFIYFQSKNVGPTYEPGKWPEYDTAVNQAMHFYSLRAQTGEDLSEGPCLSNALLPGWVADIAHSPRVAVDDLPQNQCSAYLEGRAQHFVELDLEGNVIRVR